MASVKDLIYVLRTLGPLQLGLRVYREVNTDNVFTNAAAMAYAWVFAVFPLVIFLMTLVPYLPDQLREQTPGYITKVMYGAGMQYAIVGPVEETIKNLLTNTHGGLLSFGLLLTLYAASGGMNTTMSGLDAALDVEKARPFWMKRLIAMLLTVFMGVCFVVVMMLLPIGTVATTLLTRNVHLLPVWMQDWLPSTLIVATLARYVFGLIVLQAMIGVLYYAGPSKRAGLRFFTPGAIFAAVGWIVTALLLKVYFAHFNSYSKTYGAVAGMVIMLMVFYLDATIVLVGAELDNEVMRAKREATGKSWAAAVPTV